DIERREEREREGRRGERGREREAMAHGRITVSSEKCSHAPSTVVCFQTPVSGQAHQPKPGIIIQETREGQSVPCVGTCVCVTRVCVCVCIFLFLRQVCMCVCTSGSLNEHFSRSAWRVFSSKTHHHHHHLPMCSQFKD